MLKSNMLVPLNDCVANTSSCGRNCVRTKSATEANNLRESISSRNCQKLVKPDDISRKLSIRQAKNDGDLIGLSIVQLEEISNSSNTESDMQFDFSEEDSNRYTEMSYLSSSEDEDDSFLPSFCAKPSKSPGRPPLHRSSKSLSNISSKSLSNILSGSSLRRHRRGKWGRVASPPDRYDEYIPVLDVSSWKRYPRVWNSPIMPSLAPASSVGSWGSGSFDSDSEYDDDDEKAIQFNQNYIAYLRKYSKPLR